MKFARDFFFTRFGIQHRPNGLAQLLPCADLRNALTPPRMIFGLGYRKLALKETSAPGLPGFPWACFTRAGVRRLFKIFEIHPSTIYLRIS